MTKPPLGHYRHYKGHEYELFAIGTHSETLEPMAIYRRLDDPHEVWVRPLTMFTETVEIDGQSVSRFTPIPN